MRSRVHAIAGLLGLLLITLFFSSSIIVELFGTEHDIAMVKQLIVIGVAILIPIMMIVGGSGRSMLRKRRGAVIRVKQRRMVAIAAIGIAVLTPCAVILRQLSANSDFGVAFSLVQAIELLGGAVNITLMSLNAYAGMRLTGRIKLKKPAMNAA